MSGESITFTMGINDFEQFNPHYYDRRFKLHPVTGYTNSPNQRFSGNTKETLYNIVSKTGSTVGYYNELYGGFYQGFYKLFGYDYEVFPERVNKGWTSELLLKPRLKEIYFPSSGQTYLNDVYSGNSGTFFFMGTRAENKYYHPASGSPVSDTGYTRVTSGLTECIKTCACADTGVTNSDCFKVYPQTATTQVHRTGSCGSYTESVPVKLQDPDDDLFSNALSIRFSGDPQNPRICVKYIKFTGDCITTGTCENTGVTYSSGYTIVETCSTNGIYDDCLYSGCTLTKDESWVMVSTVFERYVTLEDCDLLNWGGLGDVRELFYPSELNGASYNMIMPPQTHSGDTKEELRSYIELNRKWFEDRIKRLGVLKIYVNGYLFMEIADFEEIIPHELNTEKEKQLGVPFNISIGGGTQGLRESLAFSGCTNREGPYIQDPELMPNQTLSGTSLSGLTTDIIMEPTFGGTFMGGISQFRMYTEPLSSPQIQHNFRILKDKFNLYDFWCDNCKDCTVEEIDISGSFNPGSIVYSFDASATTICNEDYNISFTCLLDTVTGGTITFDENITILKGNSTGSTGIKTLNDYEFSALTETGSYVLSATTVSATTTPFNCNFKTNFIYELNFNDLPVSPTPTQTITPTLTPTNSITPTLVLHQPTPLLQLTL